jgi:Tol biopolymer transport system component
VSIGGRTVRYSRGVSRPPTARTVDLSGPTADSRYWIDTAAVTGGTVHDPIDIQSHNAPPTRWLLTVAIVAGLSAACADSGSPTVPVTPEPPQSPGPPDPPAPPSPPSLPGVSGRIAFASTRDGASWIYVADSTGVRRLTRGDEPAWSPDGTTIAFESSAGISLIRADGTGLRGVRDGGYQPAWSPDGTAIAFRDGGIRVMHANGGGERLLVDDDFTQEGDELRRPAWSADGRRIAFVRHDCCWMWPPEIYVVGLDGARPALVMPSGLDGTHYHHWSPAWSPDGRTLAFIHDFFIMTTAVGTDAFRTLGVRAAWESKLDWSPDGTHLLFSDYNGDAALASPPFNGKLRIYSASLATGEKRQLIPEAGSPVNTDYGDTHAVWSPGERRAREEPGVTHRFVTGGPPS